MNRRWRLVRVPGAEISASDFELVEQAARQPEAGEVLLRSVVLSLDPYQRNWLAGAPGYGTPPRPGDTPLGRAISEVVVSADRRFAPGDIVLAESGWQSHPTVGADRLQPLAPAPGRLSAYLGVLGSPGLTAWVGMNDICRPERGETVLVSAAGGAVGSVAAQIALIRGARVVGVAGAPQKCERVVAEFGLAGCVSHREKDLAAALARACPDGIDAYFDNTGGRVTAAAWPLLRHGGRVALCGLVAEYGRGDVPGPNLLPLLAKRASVRGFSVREHLHRLPEYQRQALDWMRQGRLHDIENLVVGIEQVPRAFMAMLSGDTFGKTLVRLGADPDDG